MGVSFKLKLFCFFVLLLLGYGIHTLIQRQKFSVHVIPRHDWGAVHPVSICKKNAPDKIMIHHSAGYDERYSARQHIKSYQKISQEEKGWKDIPYHFLIDPSGLVYAGRSIHCVGDTKTKYDPAGYVQICLLGNFNDQKPNLKQVKSLINLTTWICYKYKINPMRIVTHRDVVQTYCPGEFLYRFINKYNLPLSVQRKLNAHAD